MFEYVKIITAADKVFYKVSYPPTSHLNSDLKVQV